MAPPPQQECSKEDCDFSTPLNLPTWDLILKSLELHNQACHHTPASAPGNEKQKLERLPRPTFDLGMTEKDWGYQTMNWQSYITQTMVSAKEQLLQLRAACTEDLLRRVYEAGDFSQITTAEMLLDKMKLLAVKKIHKSRHMTNMWDMKQSEGENQSFCDQNNWRSRPLRLVCSLYYS